MSTRQHPADGGVDTDVLDADWSEQPEPAPKAPEEKPDDACSRWKYCGNTVPGRGEMCAECLDLVRGATDGRVP